MGNDSNEMGGMGLLVGMMVDVFKNTAEGLSDLIAKCDEEGRTEVTVAELKQIKDDSMRKIFEDENSLTNSLLKREETSEATV